MVEEPYSIHSRVTGFHGLASRSWKQATNFAVSPPCWSLEPINSRWCSACTKASSAACRRSRCRDKGDGDRPVTRVDQDRAMADVSKLVDDLSSLTVLEAAELTRLLKEKWRPPKVSLADIKNDLPLWPDEV